MTNELMTITRASLVLSLHTKLSQYFISSPL